MRLAPSSLYSIRPGDLGTLDTLTIMQALVREGKSNNLVRQLTARLVRNLPQKDYIGEARIIQAFVRDNVRYVRDIRGMETVHAPEFIIKNGYGDCDDKSVLAASMLESIGHKTRFTVVGPGTRGFCHVYVEDFLDGEWVAIECTEPVPLGWRAPNMRNSKSVEN